MVRVRKLSWLLAVVALMVCLAASYGAYVLAGYSWDQVVSYESRYAEPGRPWDDAVTEGKLGSVEASGSPRLVLVIVDGLRLSESQSLMSSLNTLRGYGADLIATTPQPSLSYPTWTTILSGASPDISGVTTNWYEGAVPVETILDVALEEGLTAVVVGPDSFGELYLADRAQGSYFEPWSEERYMSSGFVDAAIDLIEENDPHLAVVHLPDADEAAHQHGPDSDEYEETVARIDQDISRLVAATQDDRTLFVITADHGHVDGGGHGGWETQATRVPAVFVGEGITLGRGAINQVDIAPTAAAAMGLRPPRNSVGRVREEVLRADSEGIAEGQKQYRKQAERYLEVLEGSAARLGRSANVDAIDVALMEARDERLAADRSARFPILALALTAAFVLVVIIGALSWRALVAGAAGVLSYYIVYNFLYFVIHGHQWSLSAFNTETFVEMFFNIRMAEAAISDLVAVFIAAVVYPFLRTAPRGARGSYLGGWLSLGPGVVLLVQATLAVQVAWFVYMWGADVVWGLPDLKWGFKYDLDLIQMTALGAAALLSPLVAFVVGRYHPRVRAAHVETHADSAGAELPAGHGGL